MKKQNFLRSFFVSIVVLLFTNVSFAQANNLDKVEKQIFENSFKFLSEADQDLLFNAADNKNNVIVFFKDEDAKKVFPKLNKTVLATIKEQAMFVLGEKPSFPIYIRQDSYFMYDIKKLSSQLSNTSFDFAALIFAAKLSHEINHIRNKDENVEVSELQAREHEYAIFTKLAKPYLPELEKLNFLKEYEKILRGYESEIRAAK